MSYLKYDKSQLVNLEYSLSREVLRTNRAGSYALTSLVGCNTRKYHGLLVCPLEHFGGERHVLLSAIDETVIQHEKEFNIGIRKYQGDYYEPKGHKYIRDFEADEVPVTTIRVGGVVFTRERLLSERREQILIKYTLREAHSETIMRFQPFLAFRENHKLSEANMYANTKSAAVENGRKFRLYDGYPHLFIQFSKKPEFVAVPDWYYKAEYIREQERGYQYQEDLYVPGYFEVHVKKGESIILSASTRQINPSGLKQEFTRESKKRIPRNGFKNCLINSAEQFFIRRKEEVNIIAGYPWFGVWGRDTFVSVPGLTLALDDPDTCKAVLDSQVKKMRAGLFPNIEGSKGHAFNSVDAALWFIWAVQQYTGYTGNSGATWSLYGNALKEILEAYRDGTGFGIGMKENHLIYAGAEGKALTWMDAIVHDGPVTPRMGYNVEINALWYNAVCFYIDLAGQSGNQSSIGSWEAIPENVAKSFIEEFWSAEKGYLADYTTDGKKDWSVRPNQIFAASLPFSPVDDEIKKAILDVVENNLLTPRGLRTLSPRDPDYKGTYSGTQEERDRAYHQGTVWPWLFGHFAEAYLRLYKASGLNRIQTLINGFEDEMVNDGIGSISEIYDGDPPHRGKGAISQAWSVAEILRSMKLVESLKGTTRDK